MNTEIDFSLSKQSGFTGINTQPPRAWFIPYSCRCNALAGARILNGQTPEAAYAGIISEKATRRKLLNGTWQYFACSTEQEAINYLSSEQATFNTLSIPCCTANAPINILQRDFSTPYHWTGREIYLNFDGLKGFCYIYINNSFVGAFNKEQSATEFLITPLLKAGQNKLTLVIVGNTEINHDIYLTARSQEHIKDFNISTTLDTITVNVFSTAKNAAATIELYDENNQLAARKDSIIKDHKTSFEIKIDNPICWTAEKPYLYTALIHGFGEVIPVRVALRTVLYKNNELQINGKAIKIKAYNSSLLCHNTAKSFLNQALQELIELKQNNINTLISSGNTGNALFAKLCDELGFYIIDEAQRKIEALPVLKASYSPVTIENAEISFTKQKYKFTNNCDFTNLSDFIISYKIKTPSQVFKQGILDISCAPGEEFFETISYTFPEFSFEEFFVEFTCRLKTDTPWAEAGFRLGFTQIKLPVLQTVPETETTSSMPPLCIRNCDTAESIIKIEGEDFVYSFDLSKGTFLNITFNDTEMLCNKPFFSLGFSKDSNTNSSFQADYCKILSKSSKYITLLAGYTILSKEKEPLAVISVLWAIYGSGEIGLGVTAQILSENTDFKRFGFQFDMPTENQFIKYYGFGPYTSYFDKTEHCKKGIFPSAFPTENHFATQWALIYDTYGKGIMIKGMPDFDFSANNGTIYVDCKNSGYYSRTLTDKQFYYSFTIKPIFTENTDILRETRTLPGISEV